MMKFFLKKEMKFNTISKQKILFDHLHPNVGWFCAVEDSFQKKYLVGWWLHQMLFDLQFVKKHGGTWGELWAFFSCVIKKVPVRGPGRLWLLF